jgi:hypothetical protein
VENPEKEHQTSGEPCAQASEIPIRISTPTVKNNFVRWSFYSFRAPLPNHLWNSAECEVLPGSERETVAISLV